METEGPHHGGTQAGPAGSLAAALEREHHEIDDGLEAYTAAGGATDEGREALQRATDALRRHIFLEEEMLFPQLQEAGMVAPVLVMLREHARIWGTLAAIERELRAGGSGLHLCHRLAVELQHHNLKEERILYPQADVVLAEPAAEHLRAFLETGELPAGWVCHRYDPENA